MVLDIRKCMYFLQQAYVRGPWGRRCSRKLGQPLQRVEHLGRSQLLFGTVRMWSRKLLTIFPPDPWLGYENHAFTGSSPSLPPGTRIAAQPVSCAPCCIWGCHALQRENPEENWRDSYFKMHLAPYLETPYGSEGAR